MIDRLQGFFGFTRTPFGRDLAPGMLHRHAAHGEAVARIGWCVTEHRIGRHAHLKARPETPPELPAATGIDYARLIDALHQAQLGDPGTGVNYAALAGSTLAGSNDQLPGQLDLLTDGPTTDGEVVS